MLITSAWADKAAANKAAANKPRTIVFSNIFRLLT